MSAEMGGGVSAFGVIISDATKSMEHFTGTETSSVSAAVTGKARSSRPSTVFDRTTSF